MHVLFAFRTHAIVWRNRNGYSGSEEEPDVEHAAEIPVSEEQTTTGRSARAASSVFWVMFAINLFNYLDRYVLPAALSKIQNEFRLSDTQAGALSTAFLLVYAVAALPLSIWADRGVRKNVISLCVAIWSGATFLSGLATGFWTLFGARALVGIGEAATTRRARRSSATIIPAQRAPA